MKASVEMEIKQVCPICGNEANSPHHVKPRSLGGTDSPRNIIWLCKHCHDVVEEEQERTGVELSPDLINEMRRKLQIKLGENEDGISESYIGLTLLWIILPGKTKRWVNQYIGEKPEEVIAEEKPLSSSTIITTVVKRRSGGRPPFEEIDTTYLEELANNKGLSYRQISEQLLKQGFEISHEAIRKRIIHSVNYILPVQVECKRCGELFTPDGSRRKYCSPECNLIARRCTTELLLGKRDNGN